MYRWVDNTPNSRYDSPTLETKIVKWIRSIKNNFMWKTLLSTSLETLCYHVFVQGYYRCAEACLYLGRLEEAANVNELGIKHTKKDEEQLKILHIQKEKIARSKCHCWLYLLCSYYYSYTNSVILAANGSNWWLACVYWKQALIL